MRRTALLLGLTALLAAPAAAQVPLADVRIGAHAALPMGDLADAYTAGFGAYARVGLPLGVAKIVASGSWTRLRGKSIPIFGEVPDEDVFTLQIGPHFSPVPLMDLGVDVGYYMNGDVFNKAGLAPNISLGALSFDLTATYNYVFTDPKTSWVNLGIGFRF